MGKTPEIRRGYATGTLELHRQHQLFQGTVRFMLYTQKLTAQVFIVFLERLITKRAQKLMWIVDRHPVHRSNAVKQWLAKHHDAIEMIYLPPYAPQLNPAEYLNCDLKLGVHFTTADSQSGSVAATSAVASA